MIAVDKDSDEWTKLEAFVRSLGLSMTETAADVRVRAGWAEAARQMHECGDDGLLIDDVFDDERLFTGKLADNQNRR